MRRLAPFLCCAILLATVGTTIDAADARDAKRAMSLVTRGEKSLGTGNLDRAEEQFQKSLDTLEGFPPALIGLGHVAMARGEFEKALDNYRASIDSYDLLGAVMREIQAQRYTRAEAEIRSLEDSLNNLRQNSSSGTVNLDASKVENQIERLRAIEPPSPDDEEQEVPGEIYFHIGNALFRLNRVGEAIDAWHECARRSPEFAMVHNNLAFAYFQQGKIDEARTELALAEELGFPVHPQFKADLEKAGS